MPTNPTQPTLTDPKGVDTVFEDIRPTLEAQVSWLQTAYGRCLSVEEEGETYPAVYVGDQDYLKLLPDGHLGSHSFFRVSGRESVKHEGDFKSGAVEVMLVVWINFEEAFPGDYQTKTIANAVDDVLDGLKVCRSGANAITPKAVIYDKQYQGFTRQMNQDLIRPYGGFAVIIDIKWVQGC